jgi:hypothetical protein
VDNFVDNSVDKLWIVWITPLFAASLCGYVDNYSHRLAVIVDNSVDNFVDRLWILWITWPLTACSCGYVDNFYPIER